MVLSNSDLSVVTAALEVGQSDITLITRSCIELLFMIDGAVKIQHYIINIMFIVGV
jgi:hypothetical protein